MADKPFDRVVFNLRERLVSQDLNRLQSELDRRARDMLDLASQTFTSITDPTALPRASGFQLDGFRCRGSAVPGMSVVVSRGAGFIRDAAEAVAGVSSVAGLDDLAEFKPLYLTTDQTIPVPTADPTNPRIDIVEVRYNRAVTDVDSRDVLQVPPVNGFLPTAVSKTLSFTLDGLTSVNGAGPINYKTGTPAGSPAVPATTAGYVKIGEVRVAALASTLGLGEIADQRNVLLPGGVLCGGATWVHTTSNPPTNLRMSCPPGVRVFVQRTSNSEGSVYLLVPDNIREGVATMSGCANAAISTAEMRSVSHSQFLVSAQVGSTEKTILEASAVVPAGQKVALNQRFLKLDYVIFKEGGALSNAAASQVHLNFTLRDSV